MITAIGKPHRRARRYPPSLGSPLPRTAPRHPPLVGLIAAVGPIIDRVQPGRGPFGDDAPDVGVNVAHVVVTFVGPAAEASTRAPVNEQAAATRYDVSYPPALSYSQPSSNGPPAV